MKIDWFTVIAQLINFGVLIWLLRRFLYKPVLNAVDAREKKIKSELDEANERQEQAKAELKKHRQQVAAFEADKQTAWNQLEQELGDKRKRELDAVKAEATELREQMKKRLDQETASLTQSFRENIRTGVFQVACKALDELSTGSLNHQIVEKLIHRLQNLTPEEKEKFQSAINGNQGGVEVATAFPIEDAQQKALAAVLTSDFGAQQQPEFVEKPSLVGGVELTVNDYSIAWNIDQYLNGLEKKTAALFSAKSSADV